MFLGPRNLFLTKYSTYTWEGSCYYSLSHSPRPICRRIYAFRYSFHLFHDCLTMIVFVEWSVFPGKRQETYVPMWIDTIHLLYPRDISYIALKLCPEPQVTRLFKRRHALTFSHSQRLIVGMRVSHACPTIPLWPTSPRQVTGTERWESVHATVMRWSNFRLLMSLQRPGNGGGCSFRISGWMDIPVAVESTLVGPHETRAHERGIHTYLDFSSALHRSGIRKIGSINAGRAGKKRMS